MTSGQFILYYKIVNCQELMVKVLLQTYKISGEKAQKFQIYRKVEGREVRMIRFFDSLRIELIEIHEKNLELSIDKSNQKEYIMKCRY